MSTLTGAVDYWCNSFLPARRTAWQRAIDAQDLPLKAGRPGDDFCAPDDMVARLDSAGFATVLVPVCEPGADAESDGWEAVTAAPAELAEIHHQHPDRFRGLWSVDPRSGMAGVEQAAAALAQPWCVGLMTHTHSFDRTFDHADYYPYYSLCATEDVPFVMQAGTSGGRYPSECGRPIGIDRPAIYFPTVRFVLSHTGWPWVTEAVAMALKFSNVYLGTATYPPKRWSTELVAFAAGPGRHKVVYGSGFPTSGHNQAAEQFSAAEFDDKLVHAVTRDTARAVFTRLGSAADQGE
ncbi:MAG: amidohydrolase family protein [Acidimicrobiales bacterium]